MIIRIIQLVPFLAIDWTLVGADEPRDGQGGLRGVDDKGPPVRKLAGLFGPNAQDDNKYDGEDDGGGPKKRELSGRVIISRKSEKKLKKEGKTPNEIAAIRSRGMSEIKKNKVVFESGGDGDFQVVDVGMGREASFIKKLTRGPNKDLFAYAEEDWIEYPVAIAPNDPLLNNQYHHDNMQSRLAWDISTGSASVTVAICDTGLQVDHPDLAGNKLPGYQATTQTWEVDGGDVSAVHPHGTMCAGCAASIGDNGVGISGVGWNFKHRPGRVSDDSGGGASSAVLADCARKMCELSDVKVASVSYSGVEGSARRSAATYCKEQGALMVNAAGNDGRDLSQYGEADADDLIVAGASDINDNKASFSAYGTFVDAWAPGVSVYTTTTGSTYQGVSGTSFSCPLIAGLIALIWSVDPDLTPDQVETILKESTDNVGIQGPYNTAYGRINSWNAVRMANSNTPFPTTAPTTAPPTQAPTTSSPTLPTQPTIQAAHDGTSLRCTEIGGACTSGDLLNGRSSLAGNPEPNHPNTIDGCVDGGSGTYHSDESNDGIEVYAALGGRLQVGRMAVVKATVWAWNNGASDTADFYVTEGDSNPTWNYLGSVKPTAGGVQILESPPFELTSTLQTARVHFRYTGSPNPCNNGNWDESDDLVFAVDPSGAPTTPLPTTTPSRAPTNVPTTPPTSVPTKNPVTAPPTANPVTASPTANPVTASPTANPVTAPPTTNPTDAPTNVPTTPPTSMPTKNPVTAPPTANPTDAPTNVPTTPPPTPPPCTGQKQGPCDATTNCCGGVGDCFSGGRWAGTCK